MLNSEERIRSVDLDALSEEALAAAAEALNLKLSKIFETANLEANRLLKPYGMKLEVKIDLVEIEE